MTSLGKITRRLPRLLRKGRVLIVLAFAAAVFGLTQTQWFARYIPFQKLEHARTDWRFRARGNVSGHPDIVIVGITASSLDQGLVREKAHEAEAIRLMDSPWPWNRRVFALLIERLMVEGARVVALDILFPGEREGNAELAAVIAKYQERVVLASTMVLESGDRFDRRQTFILPDASLIPAGGESVVGYAFYRPDVDGVIRRVSHRTSQLREYGVDDEARDLTGFSALALEKFTGQRAPDGRDQLINFPGPATTYPHLAIEEIFVDSIFRRDPKFQGGAVFRDKLVFIGPIAETFHDVHDTPYGSMPGVEIHAQTAGALLSGTHLRELPIRSATWLTLCTAATAALIAVFVRQAAVQFAVLVGLGVVFMVASQLLFQRQHLVIPMVPSLFALIAIGLFGIVFHFVIEQLERARIRAVLDKYVSRNVASLVMENSDSFEQALRGQSKFVTVLFSDIRGFTTISETLDPKALVPQLNEYFLPMVDAVLREGGTLQKFIGDAIMAVWGDTHSLGRETDAARAVRTALQMRTALTELNEQWVGNPSRSPLASGIGINHGEVIVGEIGHPQRMEFTVLGDGVNLAARLESATKQFHCDILVGEKVEELTRGEFVYRRVDRLRLKGKSQAVEVFLPLSGSATEPPAWLAEFHQAIELYRTRRFHDAMQSFQDVNRQLGGDDFLCAMYTARCAQFVESAPAADWDGSHTLTEK